MDLFEKSLENNRDAPLAERMRPRTLEEVVGQRHLLGEGKLLRRLIETDQLSSVIFWGPPGTGKTTLAQVIAGIDPQPLHLFLGRSAGRQGGPGDRRQGQAGEGLPRTQDRPVRGRDPPLQQGAAGRLSALCGKGRNRPDRRHHRESLLRGQFGPALPFPRLRPQPARAGGYPDSARSCPVRRAGTSGARDPKRTEAARDFLAEQAHGDARVALNTLEVAAPRREARRSTWRRRRRPCRKRPCSMTRGARNTTMSSRPSSRACGAPTPTAPSTGWPG